MIDLAKHVGPASPELLGPDYSVAVLRRGGAIHWLLSDRDNWVLDFDHWRADFVAAGHQVPDLRTVAAQRSGLAVVNEDTIDDFLRSSEVHRLSVEFLRAELVARFPAAKSWWDVEFLFPIAFIDVDRHVFAGFYHNGPKLERYVPEGWQGEFVDFANTYPPEIFPARDKFWIVDGQDLLDELNKRGRALDANRDGS